MALNGERSKGLFIHIVRRGERGDGEKKERVVFSMAVVPFLSSPVPPRAPAAFSATQPGGFWPNTPKVKLMGRRLHLHGINNKRHQLSTDLGLSWIAR